MASEFITQEEADQMLAGTLGLDILEVKDDPADEDGVRPYEIGRQERIVRGRMPTLEIINERFSRHLRVGLFSFMRKNPEITVGSVKVQKYADFVRNLAVPTNLNVVALNPLRGHGLFIFDPGLIDTIVDALFGGKNQYKSKVEGRDFTSTEQRIISSMLNVVFDEYSKSWAPVYKIKPEYVRSEMHTQFANIANPSEMVVSTSFSIEIGSSGGTFHVCFPYSTIEPVRELLYSSMQGDQIEPDKRWSSTLERQVHNTEVELVATLTKTKVKLSDVANFRVGDILFLDIPETVEATVSGIPLVKCKYGTKNGKYSLKVQDVYTDKMELALFDR